MKNRKILISIIIFLLISYSLIAESTGFTTIEPGFWKWTLSIVITIVSFFIPAVIFCFLDEFCDADEAYISDLFYLFMCSFPIIGYWLFPTVFCGILGSVLEIFVYLIFNLNKKHKVINWLYIVNLLLCIFSAAITISTWLWLKYYLVSALLEIIFLGFAYFSKLNKKKSLVYSLIFTVINTVFLIETVSINNGIINLIILTVEIIYIIIMIFSLWNEHKKYMERKKTFYNTVFHKDIKKIDKIIKTAPKMSKRYSTGKRLKEMRDSVKNAISNFMNEKYSKASYDMKKFYTAKAQVNKLDIINNEGCRAVIDAFYAIGDRLLLALSKKTDIDTDYLMDLGNGINQENDGDEEEDFVSEEIFDDEIDNDDKSIDELMNELNSMIGLSSVKEEINTIISIMKLNKEREKRGIPVTDVAFHLVFSGKPGTGKTTVARLLGEIYRKLGVLSKGKFIEVDRADLIGEFIGETEVKTRAILNKASGSILFIDEAYSLAENDSPRDFGKNAVNTILKRMEDNRKNLMVIAAGYPDEMDAFLDSNPGLRSRFTKIINFEDYNGKEMSEIFKLMCKEKGLKIEVDMNQLLEAKFDEMYLNRDEHFANARSVRTYLEDSIRRHDLRLGKLNMEDISDEQFITLDKEDLSL